VGTITGRRCREHNCTRALSRDRIELTDFVNDLAIPRSCGAFDSRFENRRRLAEKLGTFGTCQLSSDMDMDGP
jgi:hypothetical protein